MASEELREGPLRIGQRFLGKFEIRARLGRGGHAWVYHARDCFMGTHVALKVLHRPGGVTSDMLRRGQAEAQIMNRLDHPHITKVIDAGVSPDGHLYILMELLRGRSLRDALIEHKRLELHEVLNLAAQIAEGAHAAHLGGAIHRDLKPENVFVEATNRVKIVDFGIAKLIDAAAWTTEKNIVLGTMLYMSPEQVQGRPVGPRSDIYALGVTMFEALLGEHPVRLLLADPDANAWAITRAIVGRIPPMLDELDGRIPRSVASLVQKTMAKIPEQRFDSMRDAAHAIRACLGAYVKGMRGEGRVLRGRDLSRSSGPMPGSLPLAGARGSAEVHDTEPSSGPLFLGNVSSETLRQGTAFSASAEERGALLDARRVPTERLGTQSISIDRIVSTPTARRQLVTAGPVITRRTHTGGAAALSFLGAMSLPSAFLAGSALGVLLLAGLHFTYREGRRDAGEGRRAPRSAEIRSAIRAQGSGAVNAGIPASAASRVAPAPTRGAEPWPPRLGAPAPPRPALPATSAVKRAPRLQVGREDRAVARDRELARASASGAPLPSAAPPSEKDDPFSRPFGSRRGSSERRRQPRGAE